MRWLDTPPYPRLDVKLNTADRLVLTGPGVEERLAGGATAAFGGVFASVGAGFLRLPVPAPFKLIPLAFTAIGAGVAALGATAALASCSVEVQRGQGLTLRWKIPTQPERVLHLAPAELEGFEVTRHAHARGEHSDEVSVEYRLVAITRDGRAFPFERFATHTQAGLRKRAVEALALEAR